MWPKRVAKTVIASMRIFDIGSLSWGKIKNPMSERGHGSCRGRESPFLNALKQDRL